MSRPDPLRIFAAAARPGAARRLPPRLARRLAAAVKSLAGWSAVHPDSAVSFRGGWLLTGRRGTRREFAAGFAGSRPLWAEGLGPFLSSRGRSRVLIAPADHARLARLRARLPHLRPRPSGRAASIGLGDRLGLATPGHLAALRGSRLFPVLAQQSIREMTRTRRTPDEVMDDAVFGALQAGHLAGFGADADHLKTVDHVDRMARAGFVQFTLDSVEGVREVPPGCTAAALTRLFRRVPGARAWRRRYAGRRYRFGALTVAFPERELMETVVRFGRVVPLFAALARRVRRRAGRGAEIEVSVDECPAATTLQDHAFLVMELRRRGIRIQGFAPRFPGAFEKGVDYRGSPAKLAAAARAHAALARALGGYKLSIHSGSDKFRAYRALARAARGRFHLKTAGTSYLEALRVAARREPGLFREIAAFARARFRKDRATYHVSARLTSVPDPRRVPAARLERVFLKPDDARQVLHVTFGSVLTARRERRLRGSCPERARRGGVDDQSRGRRAGKWRFRDRLLELLAREERAYAVVLRRHLGRHIRGLTAA